MRRRALSASSSSASDDEEDEEEERTFMAAGNNRSFNGYRRSSKSSSSESQRKSLMSATSSADRELRRGPVDQILINIEDEMEKLTLAQEHWATWKALQEDALEQKLLEVRHREAELDYRERELKSREHSLAQTLENLRREAAAMDVRFASLLEERRRLKKKISQLTAELADASAPSGYLQDSPHSKKQQYQQYQHHSQPALSQDNIPRHHSKAVVSPPVQGERLRPSLSAQADLGNWPEGANQAQYRGQGPWTDRQFKYSARHQRCQDVKPYFHIHLESPDRTKCKVLYGGGGEPHCPAGSNAAINDRGKCEFLEPLAPPPPQPPPPPVVTEERYAPPVEQPPPIRRLRSQSDAFAPSSSSSFKPPGRRGSAAEILRAARREAWQQRKGPFSSLNLAAAEVLPPSAPGVNDTSMETRLSEFVEKKTALQQQ